MIKLYTVAAIALASLATTGAFCASPAEPGKSTIVRYADLDLGTAGGQATFQRRMRHAVDLVCGRQTDGDLAERMNRAQCRSFAQASADRGAQIAMLHRSDRLQVAAATLSGR